MITTTGSSSSRDLSLVEQKRLQWQKEREEMERMGSEIFSHSQTKYEKTSIKTYFSNVDLSINSSHYNEPNAQQQFSVPPNGENANFNPFAFGTPQQTAPPPPVPANSRSMRSPSLPPIVRERFYNYPNGQTLIINPAHSDTGYNSESSPATEGPAEVWTNDDDGRGSNKTVTLRSRPNFFDNGNRISRPDVEAHLPPPHRFPETTPHPIPQMAPHIKPLGTPNSLSSGQSFSTMSQSMGDYNARGVNQRRKWSDNETPQSYFDPMTRSLDSRSSQNVPYWLEKGLHDIRDSEDESTRSHIRGQNIPMDPNLLAERVGRRRKAMELQEAIKEQLMEQERMKKWEKEKRIQEDLLAEEKLMQQIEAERQRLEYEARMREEKLQNERRKAEIMRLAVEKAELEAKMEKDKRRMHLKDEKKSEVKAFEESVQMTEPIETPVVVAKEVIVEPVTSVENIPVEHSAPVQRKTPTQELIATPKPTDIDGIALILQNITPVVPLANIGQDLLGLNNSVNNLQFALLLAQQQQQLNIQARQLNTISSASSIMSTAASEEMQMPLNTVRDAAANQVKSTESKVQNPSGEVKECAYCCRIHGHQRGQFNSAENQNEGAKDKLNDESGIPENHEEAEEEEDIPDMNLALDVHVPKLPSDGTFIRDESDTLVDAEIATQTDSESTGNELVSWPRILTPRKYRVDSSTNTTMLVQRSEVGIQTDLLLLQNCNICTHKQLVLKEISQVTTSVTQTSSRKTELSPIRRQENINNKDGNTMTTTTITTTTTIRAKANERGSRHAKREPRPKWGVNQPAFQYVKASDRDPFCLRRRRKNQLKNYSLTDHEEEEEQYSKNKIDSGVSSNISSHSLDLYEERPQIDEDLEMGPANRRNMCTEILPITTDGNGQVFVNFQQARVVLKDEPEMRKGNSQNNGAREKIMEKRSEDLPFIPGVYKTERKLIKSLSDSNHFPNDVSKVEKEEINMSKRSEM